jgi:hypothetical protein
VATKRAKKVKVVKEANKEGIVDTVVKGVSYGTGVLVRKASSLGSDIGKVGKTKSWKKMVSGAEDLCEKVNENTKVIFKKASKSVKENLEDINESFKEGMESVAAEATQSETVQGKPSPAKKTAKSRKKSKPVQKAVKKPAPEQVAEGKAVVAPVVEEPAGNVIKKKRKAAPKKVKPAPAVTEEKLVNADLEKELEDTTKDVKET